MEREKIFFIFLSLLVSASVIVIILALAGIIPLNGKKKPNASQEHQGLVPFNCATNPSVCPCEGPLLKMEYGRATPINVPIGSGINKNSFIFEVEKRREQTDELQNLISFKELTGEKAIYIQKTKSGNVVLTSIFKPLTESQILRNNTIYIAPRDRATYAMVLTKKNDFNVIVSLFYQYEGGWALILQVENPFGFNVIYPQQINFSTLEFPHTSGIASIRQCVE